MAEEHSDSYNNNEKILDRLEALFPLLSERRTTSLSFETFSNKNGKMIIENRFIRN
jgi:hypothetical protein